MEQICRICFKTLQDGKYEITGEIRKEMFDVLLLKLDSEMCEETVMCNGCIRQHDETFEFKAMCLYTEDYIYPFVDQEGDTKLDMREVYYKNDKQNVINIDIDEDVCRLCMGVFLKNSFCSLEKIEKDMIQKYIPEVNMDATLKTLFCKSCVTSLTHNFRFIMKCLQTEEKIKSYRDTRGICDNSKVKLSQVKQSARKNENGVCNINLEDLQCNIDDDVETDDEADYSANDDNDVEENISTYSKKVIRSSKKEHCSKPLATSKRKRYCEICQKQFKTWQTLYQHNKNVHKRPSQTYKCNKCSFETRYKISMKEHELMHMDPSERQLFPCELCSYKAKRPQQLKKHLLTHKDYEEKPKFKCSVCSYEAIYYSTLKNHMLTHKDDSEVTWYRCEICSYKAKIQVLLRSHLLVHKDISEVKHFSCSLCSYKTKRKLNLHRHEITHKSLSEIPTFNCYQCSYKAKAKTYLKAHIARHHQKDAKLYSCDKCNLTTRHAGYLKSHALLHKDKSETTMYGCNKCTYKTKFKTCLNARKKNHLDQRPYKCEFCSFEFKRAGSLKRHQLTHKSVNEAPTYKCHIC